MNTIWIGTALRKISKNFKLDELHMIKILASQNLIITILFKNLAISLRGTQRFEEAKVSSDSIHF